MKQLFCNHIYKVIEIDYLRSTREKEGYYLYNKYDYYAFTYECVKCNKNVVREKKIFSCIRRNKIFIIDYNNDFNISYSLKQFNSNLYKEADNYLKYLYLNYDSNIRRWNIRSERIDEIILQLSKDKKEYRITDNAYNELEKKSNIKSEIKLYRGVDFKGEFLKKKLFNFQRESIIWRLSRNRYIDSLDAGLGKSLINISVFSHRYVNNKIDSILIIVPIGLSYHWKKEILESVSIFDEDDIIIINKDNCFQAFDAYQDKKIMIISNHHKTFAKMLLSYRKDFKKIKGYSKLRWGSFSLDINKRWKKNNVALLVDECHEFKHSSSIRSKALNAIKNNFEYRFFLSATPWINRIEHAYNQINLIDESIINMNERAFILYISDRMSRFSKDVIESYNEENVNKFLNNVNHIFDKKVKEDIEEMKAKRMPPKIIYLQINEIQKKLYQKIIESEIFKLESEYDNITWRQVLNKSYSFCSVLNNPFLLSNIVNDDIRDLLKGWSLDIDPKFTALKSLLKNYIEYCEEKVVVFCINPKTLDMLYDNFKKYNPLIIHGSLNVKDKEKDRQDKEDLFNYDDNHKVIFLSALTSSQGINLQKNCRRIIVYESPDAQRFKQLSDRVLRIDSTRDFHMDILTIDNTFDVINVNRNLNKIDFNNRLGKNITQEELSKLLRGIV